MLANLAFDDRTHDGARTGRETVAQRRRASARNALICALAILSLAGCYKRSVLPQSEGHVTTPAANPSLADVPPPARTSDFVPPPKPVVKPPTYSVIVNEVPVKELLLALARDTKQNIDIHPGLSGRVSLNAINETLPAILERMSKQVGLRVRQMGTTLVVSPDEPYSKTYRINYVNMTRNSNSIISVSGRIGGGTQSSGGQGGAASGSGSGSGSGGQTSTTSVTTVTQNDFWKVLETDVRGILTSSQNQSAQAKADRVELYRTELQLRLQDTRAAPAAALGTAKPLGGEQVDPNAVGGAATALANRNRVEDILVNPITGTITVSATESQHELIEAYLTKVQNQAQRQVLIEATIVEVNLSDQYQAGVDWSRLAISGGVTFQQQLLAGNLGVPPTFTIGYANPTSALGNIASSVKLLDQFGNVRVLSSPKLMAMNNQTALLKVVDDVVYFTVTAQPALALSGSAVAQTATFSTSPLTIEVGVVMSLTPQINENGQVILAVRPSITRLLGFVNDPNPALANPCPLTPAACTPIISPVPQTQKREMESVLQLTSGQTAILGGLMQDSTQYNRNAVPGVGNAANTGFLSEVFGYRNDKITKSELVIFLRPTIVTNPSLESEDLQYFKKFLPRQVNTPTETLPGEMAGPPK